MEYESGAHRRRPKAFRDCRAYPAVAIAIPSFSTRNARHSGSGPGCTPAISDEIPEPAVSCSGKDRLADPDRARQGRQVRAFYNTCRHRGAPLVKTDTGTATASSARIMAGPTRLDGQLINLRDKRDFVGPRHGAHSLTAVRCEQFANWVFINEDPDAQPLLETSGRSRQQFEQFQPETLRFVEKHGFDLKCNVKVLLDAFLEVYHLKSIHQSTVDRFLDHRGTSIALVSQRAFTDGDAQSASRLGGSRHARHEAHRDRDRHLVAEQSVVEFLPEPRRADRPDRLPVPAVLADRR